jgi:hypothetical protein
MIEADMQISAFVLPVALGISRWLSTGF